MGIDISPKALSLARTNLDHNLQQGLLTRRASTDIQFHRADVLGPGDDLTPSVEKVLGEYFDRPGEIDEPPLEPGCDLLISNPPYISTADFRNGTTARSVRRFEPKLALVPPPQPIYPNSGFARPEDIFYHRILEISLKLQTKVTVLECGDIEQADRVVEMYTSMTPKHCHSEVEVWPSTERDMTSYGFHPNEGSRCVIIQRQATDRK